LVKHLVEQETSPHKNLETEEGRNLEFFRRRKKRKKENY
jgi:hypothetical protein